MSHPSTRASELRAKILDLVAEYHDAAFPPTPFIPGETAVPVSGKVFDATDIQHLVDSSLDFWLTTGRFAEEFEERFAEVMGVRHALLCNSGSSANLLAISALTSPRLGQARLKPGDEVITVAAGFPTTVNPIVQNRLTPVFVDAELGTYDVNVERLAEAIGPRTRAIAMAHTLGNPFDLGAVTKLVEEHDLWLMEDTCDAVGATYAGRPVGSFGDVSTASFYPAHQITTGEGGAVMCQRRAVRRVIESFRDWGRDCWCPPGIDNTCGKRFGWDLGDLPHGYDHKYIYSHVGYNLKMTDMQAAVGVAQLYKLDDFVRTRRENFAYLHDGLTDLEEHLVLPQATSTSQPSWFGFAITVRPEAPFERLELVRALEDVGIGTRLLFGGNLLCQPAYKGVDVRIVGPLDVANLITTNTLWFGVYPGLGQPQLDHILQTVHDFVDRR